ASGVAVADLQRALRPVFEKRTEIAALDRRLKEIETERTRITADQQRVRENMKALRGSNEERQLLQRYTRQLDDQETRLAQLQQESARVGAERAENVAELSRRIASVTFEWDG